ncbi:MAG: pyrroline-5-carboxylate reductase [Desulfarculus sp.]|nr:MAG: pyrroline-5-carboxylate reductase [Desulfarculus sp.]
MALKGTIGLAGGGNMGSALLRGMLAAGLVEAGQVVVAEKIADKAAALAQELGVATVGGPAEFKGLSLLILAVKPGDVAQAAREAAPALGPDSLVITLAAGIRLASVAQVLPLGQPLVRAMPNTPALIRRGVTAICGGAGLEGRHLETARQVFGAVGQVVQVEEGLMNAVTALSGSGPAYVFAFMEALSEAGVAQGLSPEVALELTAQTVAGAALLLIERGEQPGRLREQVTSPGGTTVAGLAELSKGDLRGTLIKAVAAATRRGQELGG